MTHWQTADGRRVESRTTGRVDMLPPGFEPDAVKISNVGFFANCRRDRFCRCRRCKPALKGTRNG